MNMALAVALLLAIAVLSGALRRAWRLSIQAASCA